MELVKPICLACGNEIYVGRPDKKFCNSECKDKYNNAIKVREQKEIKKIDTILRNNRRILKKLYDPKNPAKLFNRELFIKKGYEFGFHTHFVITIIKGHEITFCYDFGYREISSQIYQVFPSFPRVHVKGGQVFEL